MLKPIVYLKKGQSRINNEINATFRIHHDRNSDMVFSPKERNPSQYILYVYLILNLLIALFNIGAYQFLVIEESIVDNY